ncbi:ATP-binding protein [Aeromicrobium camelliae]|uniref:ATP-binding protein n=1 Tax=Aeromicrobium camelliae TaxID=1538144 RepID=A0A3N6WLX9_9ACTN|nr:ATP-binding protein [Aeromicrobium camelliae]RQN08300.1 ATP-binding protein [Aeromicrobium camelliae]
MTTTVPAYRRASRPADRRVVGGVAAGLADHLAVPVVWVRIGFIVATWFNGAGILAYLLLWRFLPLATPDDAPGVESATRAGLRGSDRLGRREIAQTVAIGAVGLGVFTLLSVVGRGPSSHVLVPVLVGVVGIALVWRQLDDAAWNSWLRQTSGPGHVGRIAAGVALVGLAAIFVMSEGRGWSATLDLVAAVAVAMIGLVLILGPWISSLWHDLGEERRQRIRSQERADMAAHLHDSVLQTLALLQKNAHDPAAVATLARRQERELRDWLYGDEAPAGSTLVAGLRAEAGDVETAHQVPVELVAVGDAPMSSDVAALVRAAREAMVNAAKHAGVGRIDVYSEVAGASAEVFVRDRGVGFDPDQIPDDRQGIRGSMVERMRRHGGDTRIKSTPGEGTEVVLTMPLRETTTQEESREA